MEGPSYGKYIISGFRFRPVEHGTELPEISILSGGIGHKFIKLLLSPKTNGQSITSMIEFYGEPVNNKIGNAQENMSFMNRMKKKLFGK